MIGAILLLLASTAQAFDFSVAVACSQVEYASGKPFAWCLEGHLPLNQKVTFLERRECHAKTGEPRMVDSAIEGEGLGTSLVDFHCVGAEGGEAVVLSIDVKEYRKLPVLPLPGKKIPKGVDARIRKSADFTKLVTEHDPPYVFGETLKLYMYEIKKSTPGAKTYVATYQSDGYEDQFLFLVNKDRIEAITQDEPACSGVPEAFHLNGKDFVRMDICTCGTDACERRYLDLSKK